MSKLFSALQDNECPKKQDIRSAGWDVGSNTKYDGQGSSPQVGYEQKLEGGEGVSPAVSCERSR